MNNYEKYVQAFKETFGINEEILDNLVYQGIEEWDSVGHMNLIATLEDSFDILMEADDIIDFSSFEAGKSILKKYDVEI